MKKLLFIALTLLCFNVSAENILSVVPKGGLVAGTYSGNDLAINLNNEEPIVGIQFDIYLPEGWSTTSTRVKIYPNFTEASEEAPTNGTRNAYYDSNEEMYMVAQTAYVAVGCDASADYEGGGTCTRVITISTSAYPYSGTEGQIMQLTVKPDASANGVYPIVFKNVKIAGTEGLQLTIPCLTSYVKVGTPTDATLALEGVIPSFVNTALASETGISTLDLSAVTASNGTFTYVDGREVVEPTAEVKGNVAYTRAAQEKVASIKLPFAATTGTYYKLNDTDFTDNYAHFEAANGLEANTSALVNAGDAVSESAENVKIAGVAAEEITSGYVLKGGDFCAVNGTVTVPVMRGYFEIPTSVRGFVLNGVTGINGINAADEAETIYNVAGQKLAKTQRGINIVNGKKVTVK